MLRTRRGRVDIYVDIERIGYQDETMLKVHGLRWLFSA
jgi:hypothetical protein